MIKTAYFKDGPKAGDYTAIPNVMSHLLFPVYSPALLPKIWDLKSPPTPRFETDEYRRIGTVELYEYVGRRDG